MPARNEIPLQLRILSNPVFTIFAISAIWLLIVKIHPQTSTTAHPATIVYSELLDCWNSLYEQHGNTGHCLRLLHSNSSYLNLISLVSKLQARENIALVVLVVVCYSIAIAAIWANQDYISRAWSLRLVMGMLISAHSYLLGNLLWNQYAPIWLFVLNTLLQSLFWDYWTEAGKEIREEFFIAILRSGSVRRRFSGTINGKGQENSADGTKGLIEKSEA